MKGFIVLLLLLLSACEEAKQPKPLPKKQVHIEEKKPIYDRNDRRAENRYEDVNVNGNIDEN